MRSRLAFQRPAKRRRWRRIRPWGLCVHTSGRGIIARAERAGRPAIDLALAWYSEQGSVHYVIDHGGEIFQLLDDNRRGAHVGISRAERRAYLDGSWESTVPAQGLAHWRRRWPGIESPQHLYPGRSPNACYIGVELLPLLRPRGEHLSGLWYTDEQHRSLRYLSADLERRHDWPIGWRQTSRLVGHEDLDAFARWDSHGGWDPGALRGHPRFDWTMIG